MRPTKMAVLLLFFPFLLAAQQRIELGVQAGASNYFGDFSPKNVVSSQTQHAFGAFVRLNLNPQWSLRLQFLESKISGSDDNFSEGTVQRRRGFSFENRLRQTMAIIEWMPFESKLKTSTQDFRARMVPFLSAGYGLAFHRPQLFYNLEGSLVNPEMSGLLEQDLRANTGRPAPIFHLGIGAKIYTTKFLNIGVEWMVQPALTDYLDGASQIGNPNKNDWHTAVVAQVSYIFNPKMYDRDGDGIADEQDACPDEAGKKRHGGCPTSAFGQTSRQEKMKEVVDVDGDGIPEPFDRCPNEAGNVVFNGCPDRDGDGIIDLMDKCADFAGSVQLEGCPEEVFGEWEDAADTSTSATLDLTLAQQILQHATDGIQFEIGTDIFAENAEAFLENVVVVMKSNPNIHINIEAHTDDVGKQNDNLRLSESQAKKCLQFIVNQGIDPVRLSAKGWGDTRPVADNSTAAGRAKNRRVEFIIR